MLTLRRLQHATLISILALSTCGTGYAAELLSTQMEQANVTTPEILVDNTMITAARGSQYVVTAFPNSLKPGKMNITVNSGLVRIRGGSLSRQSPIVVNTPSARLLIKNADVIISVRNGVTRASKQSNGGYLSMESGGSSRAVARSDQELVSTSKGQPPKVVIVSRVIQLASNTQRNDSANESKTVSTAPPSLPNTAGSTLGSVGVNFGSSLAPTNTPLGHTVAQGNQAIAGTNQVSTRYEEISGNGLTIKEEGRSHGKLTNKIYTSDQLFEQTIDGQENSPSKLNKDVDPVQPGIQMSGIPSYEFSSVGNSIGFKLDLDGTFKPLGSLSDVDHTAAIFTVESGLEGEEEIEVGSGRVTLSSQFFSTEDGVGNIFSSEEEYSLLTDGLYKSPVTFGEMDNQAVLREQDNFVMLEVDNEIENQRYIFAAGDVVAANQSLDEVSVDKFYISAGLNGYEDKVNGGNKVDDIRSFTRAETVQQGTEELIDSGLLVVNHATDSNAPSRVLHTDFNLSGTGANQTSTISTTLGDVQYLDKRSDGDASTQDTNSPDGANDVVLTANTLGSSQGGVQQLVSFQSEMQNTSAGGGAADGSGAGYADYFVLENFDENAGLNGGTEHVIGDQDGSNDQQYASLRLASINGNETESALTRENGTVTGGYVAGLVNTENSNESVSIDYLLSTADPNKNLSITKGRDSSLTANIELSTGAGNAQSLTLGGGENNGTYVDEERYAASNGSATIVSSGLIEEGLNSNPGTNHTVPEYMKWGAFIGDVDPGNGVSHAHLASWVSGSVPSVGDLPTIGSASYNGTAIGNVYDGENSYVATGNYHNTWDFGTRRGIAELNNFDGKDYRGITAIQDASSQFIGALSDTDQVREVGLQGSFVENDTDSVAGVMGQFYIQGSDDYRAAGTFAADKN